MLASSIPTKFPFPFGNGAGGSFIRVVPVASQIGTNPGAASITDGFVPLNFLVPSAGGIPPDGRDANGILNQSTAWDVWQSVGGPIYYDAAQSTAIGGYPHGAILNAVGIDGGYWFSIVDNNTSDPDTGGANWIFCNLVGSGNEIIGVQKFTSSGTYTPTSGMNYVVVEGCGGGGGGSGAVNPSSGFVSLGSPGGAATSGRAFYTAAQIGASKSVTIGAGGAGGVAANGSSGGTTSLGTLLTLPGGNGGLILSPVNTPAAAGNGSASSVASGTNIIWSIRGITPGYATALAVSASSMFVGPGGATPYGSGSGTSPNSNGSTPNGNGSGGGGCACTVGGGPANGGAGAGGTLIFTEYGTA